MTDTTVKTGEISNRDKHSRWRIVLIGLAIVVAAAAAGGGVRWLQQYGVHKQEEKKQALIKKVDSIQNAALRGDYDKSNKDLADALKKPGISDDEKYALLFQQGINYENQKKYDDAIKTYQSAGAINNTQEIAEAIARTAQTKGDKEMAITYYKKAISLIPADYPAAESAKRLYEQSIKDLGGKL